MKEYPFDPFFPVVKIYYDKNTGETKHEVVKDTLYNQAVIKTYPIQKLLDEVEARRRCNQ